MVKSFKEEALNMFWADLVMGIIKLIKGLVDTFAK